MTPPVEIILHKISRTLEVKWPEGATFILPCEYLRLHSPSAETKLINVNQAEKLNHFAKVNILSIEPIGNYAVRLIFSDGHRTGIYSWDTLLKLGKQYANTK